MRPLGRLVGDLPSAVRAELERVAVAVEDVVDRLEEDPELLAERAPRALVLRRDVRGPEAEPDGGAQAAPTPGQLSLEPGGGKLTIADGSPGGAVAVTSAGQVICGGWVSLTVMSKEQETCDASVQVVVVVPTG